MKIKLAILILIFPLICFAQKQANIWYFGDHAGVSFNSGSPIALTNGQTAYCYMYPHNEGSSTICDSSGALLFYSDGENVWNRNHQIMLNGSGLFGSISSTQSSIIVPQPSSPNRFYIFTTDGWVCGGQLSHGFRYSVVDLCLENTLGDVIIAEKNILLLDTVSEKVAVTKHSNGTDYWILTHKFYSDKFYAFLLNSSGIIDTVISSCGSFHGGNISHTMGQLKFSHNGQKVAIGSVHGMLAVDNLEVLDIFDFDNSTGIISNAMALDRPNNNDMNIYGIEFSSDNSKLYVCGMPISGAAQNYLFQYDLNAGGGNIASINASLNIIQSGGMLRLNGLQLGPNNKIYRISSIDNRHLAVINSPNNYGFSCNYQDTAVSLAGRWGSYSLPSVTSRYFFQSNSSKLQACS